MRAWLLFVALSFVLAPRAAAQCECTARDALVIGHRGAGAGDPAVTENTIESALQAFAEGADMIEIDVQSTADGAVVLMHDDTVDRTTDGTGCVSALTLAQVQALDAGRGARVPTLAELLAAVSGPINIEIKLNESGACPAQDLGALVDAVAAEIRAASAEERVLVSSFALEVLRRMRASEPSIEIGYLSAAAADIDVAAAEGFEAIHLLAIVALARTITRAHDAGLRVNVWTINGESAIADALSRGADGVITDSADVAVAARAAYCEALVCPDAGPAGADAGPDGSDGGAHGADAGRASTSSGGCRATGHGRARVPALLIAVALAFLWRRPRR